MKMDLLNKLEVFIYGGTKKEAIEFYKSAEKYYEDGNYSSAKFYWLKSARYGNPYAMYKIGLCHYNGLRGKINYRKAFTAWKRAAAAGHKESRYCLAVCYLKGLGSHKKEEDAVKILYELKKTDHARAIYLLGDCYRRGIGGLSRNVDKADFYSVLACKMGFDPAHDDIIEKL